MERIANRQHPPLVFAAHPSAWILLWLHSCLI